MAFLLLSSTSLDSSGRNVLVVVLVKIRNQLGPHPLQRISHNKKGAAEFHFGFFRKRFATSSFQVGSTVFSNKMNNPIFRDDIFFSSDP